MAKKIQSTQVNKKAIREVSIEWNARKWYIYIYIYYAGYEYMINKKYFQPYKTYKPTDFGDGMLPQLARFRTMNGQRLVNNHIYHYERQKYNICNLREYMGLSTAKKLFDMKTKSNKTKTPKCSCGGAKDAIPHLFMRRENVLDPWTRFLNCWNQVG